ncbi:uncharacterized protein MAM_03314 [Metarhizium album ARSEF 1941]|uniref:Uncharacterized protein n=1 Tax=Metarhizium album (strain ARSEF 1941) TaxID=1081103 RepID=A0A0B2WZK0_METAS|nr:uncharacterized protein MAM_03314 [Metarhizium album ARSEF 1941]KHN98852.1 hypothetical protein MAM_03314 [Metarhizium album ARSEF 1941]
MEPSIPMILPKGIVINTTDVYEEVASYPIVPADKIWEYWHVYTTTNKKLKDPTARRLENFWWQVWGSNRRYLSGRALAKIYEDISLGPTIVPLHGPPNRWEGPGVPPLTKQLIVAHLNQGLDETQQRSEPPRIKSNDTSIKSLSSSASKPPPSHPILKKPNHPLPSGPKQTTRFAFPLESDDEAGRESDIPSSGSTATTGLDMMMSTKAPSTVRVLSALESTLPAGNQAFNAMETTQTARGSTQLRTVSPIPERPQDNVECESAELEDSASMPSDRPVARSVKAAGKQPMAPRMITKNLSNLSQEPSRPPVSTPLANSKPRATPDLRSSVSNRSLSSTRTDTDSSTTGSMTDSVSMAGRSLSQNGYARKSSSTQGLFTGALVTTTNVAAKGQIIDQAGSLPPSGVVDRYMDDDGLPSRPSATFLSESRMQPTQPSPAASVPMGRTRSQLTLLLEREKTKRH